MILKDCVNFLSNRSGGSFFTFNSDVFLNNKNSLDKISSFSLFTERSRSEKVNRLQAMAKINDTFGYGGKEFKKESPPVKKPLTTEPKPKKKIQTGASRPKKSVSSETGQIKPPLKNTSAGNAGAVKKWDFSANPAASSLSSVIKNNPPKSKIERGPGCPDVDPELDGMLAQLEMDEDFMKLSDNDQIAWLESLFFLDTKSKKASGKPKQFKNSHLTDLLRAVYKLLF